MANSLKTNTITKVHLIFAMLSSFSFLLVVVSMELFHYKFINEWFFSNVVVYYNVFVMILSFIPVEPALFIANIIVNIVQKRSFKYYIMPVIACVVTVVTWYFSFCFFVVRV